MCLGIKVDFGYFLGMSSNFSFVYEHIQVVHLGTKLFPVEKIKTCWSFIVYDDVSCAGGFAIKLGWVK